MKVKSLVFGMLSMLALSVAFTACSDNDDESSNDDGSVVELPKNRAFILNEGKSKANNAGIAFYAPDKDAKDSKNNFIANIYKDQNGKGLGDTGQDIIEYDDNMYVVMSGSKLLLKLNKAGVEQQSLSFSESDGSPRYMAAEDGKIYVSLYSGKVARVDAKTLTIEKYVETAANPEQMAITNNKLYVANGGVQGKGTTVSVINLATFAKEKDIEVLINPNLMLEANDEIYLISWGNFGDIPYSFQRIKTDGTYENLAEATFFAEHDDMIYLILSKTNWNVSPATTVNTYFTYNAKTHTLNKESFLKKNVPAELASAGVYAINVSDDGDIYVTTSDYTTNGDVYRFSSNGTFIEKFDCGGINPRKILFID